MIYTTFGTEIEILWGDMTSGELIYRRKSEETVQICSLGEIKADGGLAEIEQNINELGKNIISAAISMKQLWFQWLRWQHIIVKAKIAKAGILNEITPLETLRGFIRWLDGLPEFPVRNGLLAKTARLSPLTRSLIGAAERSKKETRHA